jgi:hypothetical protein
VSTFRICMLMTILLSILSVKWHFTKIVRLSVSTSTRPPNPVLEIFMGTLCIWPFFLLHY